MDYLVPLTHHDPRDLELICLVKKDNPFSDSLGFTDPILDFLKETHPFSYTVRYHYENHLLIPGMKKKEMYIFWAQGVKGLPRKRSYLPGKSSIAAHEVYDPSLH